MLNPALTRCQQMQTSLHWRYIYKYEKQLTTNYIYVSHHVKKMYIFGYLRGPWGVPSIITKGSSCSRLSLHPYQCTCQIIKQSNQNADLITLETYVQLGQKLTTSCSYMCHNVKT